MTKIKMIIAALLITLGVAAFGVSNASATEQPPTSEACYEQVPYQEFQFLKTVTTPAVEEVSHVEYLYSKEVKTPVYGDVIEKQVKGKIQTRSYGWWFDTGTFDWIDWPGAGPLNDDGRNRGPGAHDSVFDQTGNGNGSTRKVSTQYRYVVVGQFVKGYTTSTESSGWVKNTLDSPWVLVDSKTVIDVAYVPAFDTTYYFTGAEPSTSIEAAIWTETNPGEPWKQFNEREKSRQVEVTCPTVPTTTQAPTTTAAPTTTQAPTTTIAATTTVPAPSSSDAPTTTVAPTTTAATGSTVLITTPHPTVTTVPKGDLPATGSDFSLTLILAALAAAVGSVLILVRRPSAN